MLTQPGCVRTALVVGCLVFGFSGAAVAAECGDVFGNCDGVFASDALAVLRRAIGVPTPLVCDAVCATTTTVTSTSTSSTTTEPPALCPTNAPLIDLRNDCSHLAYGYVSGGVAELLVTNGDEVVIGQSDGVDVLIYIGPVTGRRTFALEGLSANDGPFYGLGGGSGGSISSTGSTLSFTVIFGGNSYAFNGARFDRVEPLRRSAAGGAFGDASGDASGEGVLDAAAFGESMRRAVASREHAEPSASDDSGVLFDRHFGNLLRSVAP